MNKDIQYKTFRKEIEKTSGKISDALGTGISKVLEKAWQHPKITLGVGGAAVFGPRIVKHLFPGYMVASEQKKRRLMKEENRMITGLLQYERLKQSHRMKKPKPTQKRYKPDLA